MGYAIPHGIDAVTALGWQVERLELKRRQLSSVDSTMFSAEIARLDAEINKVQRWLESPSALFLAIDDELSGLTSDDERESGAG